MIQDIVKREYYKHSSCPLRSNGSVIVTLRCGHTKHYKYSQCPEHRAQCTECDRERQKKK